jgi:hypothetical protein
MYKHERVCVCVCVRERERERERAYLSTCKLKRGKVTRGVPNRLARLAWSMKTLLGQERQFGSLRQARQN